ncbi:MAG TPA: endolytic transglycosylase MltG, partial [Ktedonobacterales bacterium]|nr:endolytic transglycosylase MltG [Ktedonobacterales bacterium]
MKKVVLVITIICSLLAFACGFAGVSAALLITQPSVAGSTATVQFVVQPGDTTASVANRLQHAGLIRNALLFRLYARYKHLDTGIEPGVYNLSPAMTMSAIAAVLQMGRPDEVVVTAPDGLRVTQYPSFMSGLRTFSAQNFLQIAKTGKFLEGTTVSAQFWYVEP